MLLNCVMLYIYAVHQKRKMAFNTLLILHIYVFMFNKPVLFCVLGGYLDMSTNSTPHSPTVSIYILVLYYIFNPQITVLGFDVFILVHVSFSQCKNIKKVLFFTWSQQI